MFNNSYIEMHCLKVLKYFRKKFLHKVVVSRDFVYFPGCQTILWGHFWYKSAKLTILKTNFSKKPAKKIFCPMSGKLNFNSITINTNVIFPPGLTFLASVFWTFLPYFSDPVWVPVLRRIQSPYLIKKELKCIVRESNPGLLGDRSLYYPLDHEGLMMV